jgi:hypothetical protein
MSYASIPRVSDAELAALFPKTPRVAEKPRARPVAGRWMVHNGKLSVFGPTLADAFRLWCECRGIK